MPIPGKNDNRAGRTTIVNNDHGRQWPYPGARWWKFDLHTHTPCSHDTHWHRHRGIDGELTPEQWLQQFMDADIDCVAITDHNSGEWIDVLGAAYERMRNTRSPDFRELHLFPGVEISVNAGFRLLGIFDPGTTAADIDTLLGAVGFTGTKGSSDDVTRESARKVVAAVLAAGGVPVPAHADSAKGLLRVKEGSTKTELDANTVRQVLSCQGVLAMEVVDRSWTKPHLYEQSGVTWTEVFGSDCHSFRGANLPGSRYTWVKMETPSIEGLRLALMDGTGFSIRSHDDPSPTTLPTHFVESIELADLQYMGRGESAVIRLNPRLNALVGGRGTGKSTVVHALRLAARREGDLESLDEHSEPRLVFARFNQIPEHSRAPGGLRETTRITWTVMRDNVRYRVHWSGNEDECSVEEQVDETSWRPSSVQRVSRSRFPIRIFSQGEIATLAGEDQQALLKVVDDAAGGTELQRHLEEAQEAFYASRARIRELDRKLARRDSCLVERQDVGRKLKRFEEAGHAQILTDFKRRTRQREEIDRQLELTESSAAAISRTADSLSLEDPPPAVFDGGQGDDRNALFVISKLGEAMEHAAQELRDTAQRLAGVVKRLRDELSGSSWRAAVDGAERTYNEWVDKLREEGVDDPSEYGRLVQDRQQLDGELARLDSMREDRKRLVSESRVRLHRVLEARRALSEARERFLAEVLAGNDFVAIDVCAYGADLRAVERSLRRALDVLDDRFAEDILVVADGRPPKGEVAKLFADLPVDRSAMRLQIEARIERLKERITRACDGSNEFGGRFNNYLKREVQRTPELLDRLLAWFPEDGLNVEYCRSGQANDFQPIGQASAGQRSAAMLAFLLAHGEEPLVLDQPEDDLDNQLIYDLIVRQIREQKRNRQIIIVTHNANVVVNGDAELVHVLDFRNQCFVRQKGSLQQDAMRAEVCRVMEGGREAFDLRYRRLGPDPADV